MSKMKMPEMSVVRFTESDVIVASVMLTSVILHNFTDGGSGAVTNGYIETSDGNYGSSMSEGNHFEDAYRMYSNFGPSTAFWWGETSEPSGHLAFSELLANDGSGIAAPGADGTYTWNGSAFTKQ